MNPTTKPVWAVTPEKIAEAVRRLVEAADPRKIILFGSRARGDAREDSDLDLLVVKREVEDRVAEIVRLNRVLKGLILPIELVVISERMFEELASTPGTVYFEAKREGEVLYESP
ncbi:MAG: nucleotidyltransferase domain-containing protein [Verrucomicrobia bacterium]|nr:nucleotidyltransferase domain-containing protein [Verrucomicrobiota bacterium]